MGEVEYDEYGEYQNLGEYYGEYQSSREYQEAKQLDRESKQFEQGPIQIEEELTQRVSYEINAKAQTATSISKRKVILTGLVVLVLILIGTLSIVFGSGIGIMEKSTKPCKKSPSNGWPIESNGYYYRSLMEANTWKTSQQMCKKLKGDLAHLGIERSETRRELIAMIGRGWLGFERKNDEWISLSGSKGEYINWGRNQPNVAENANCGELLEEALVGNVRCNFFRIGICERPVCS